MFRFLSLTLALQTLTASIALALPARSFSARLIPAIPSQDPFYQPPPGFASAAPGEILRQRTIDATFFGLIPDLVEGYQLLYRTTAVNGSAIATVTTIFKPLLAHTDRFVSFSTAYDSSGATQCDPSYTYQLGTDQQDLTSSAEFILIQAYLASGYIVSSPDYEGPDVAFTPGHLEGMAVLDSMRAVSNFQSTLELSTAQPAIVGVGYSGGAIATGWAASLHSVYAPELPVKGWVGGGTPANLTATAMFVDGTLFSGLLPAAINGLVKPSAYGAQLKPFIDRIVTPHGRQVLDQANENCVVIDVASFSGQRILSYDFQSEGPQLLYDPLLRSIMDLNTMGINKTETPIAPVFLYHASQDEIIPYDNTAQLVNTWCSEGVSVEFTTFGNGGHITTEVVGLPGVLAFVASAFAGTTTPGCTSNTKDGNLLNPIALGVELEPILTKLIDVLIEAGEGDQKVRNDISAYQNEAS